MEEVGYWLPLFTPYCDKLPLLAVQLMPFNDLEKKRIENALDKFLAKRRPPPHIRKELDFGYA